MEMNADWKYEFSPLILMRGRDYYNNGLVSEIVRTDDGFAAVVEGTYDYNVMIELDADGNFLSADCDCPYAEDGNYCKHEAAVLFALQDNEDCHEINDSASEDDHDTLYEAVSSLSKEELASFVLSLAESSTTIRDMILSQYSSRLPASFFSEIKDEISCEFRTIKAVQDDWFDEFNDDVIHAADEIERIIDDKIIGIVLPKGYYHEAFDLAFFIMERAPFDVLSEQAQDGGGAIVSSVTDVFREACQKADEGAKAQMRKRCESFFSGLRNHDSVYFSFASFLLDSFQDKKLAEILIRKFSGSDSSEAIGLVIKAYKTMGDRHELLDFVEAHLDSETAIRLGYEYISETSETEVVISFLLKARKRLSESDSCRWSFHTAKEEISEWLLAIYREHGMPEAYLDELSYSLLHLNQRGTEKAAEFKRLAEPERWQKLYSVLRSSRKHDAFYESLLVMEKDYEALMEHLESGFCFSHQKYDRLLYQHYPDRLIAFLEKRLQESMKSMHDRSSYASFAANLKYLSSFEKGLPRAVAIASDALAEYPNRPALKDELRKAGFWG